MSDTSAPPGPPPPPPPPPPPGPALGGWFSGGPRRKAVRGARPKASPPPPAPSPGPFGGPGPFPFPAFGALGFPGAFGFPGAAPAPAAGPADPYGILRPDSSEAAEAGAGAPDAPDAPDASDASDASEGEGPGGPGGPGGARPGGPGDLCRRACGGRLSRGAGGGSLACEGCGLVEDAGGSEDDEPAHAPRALPRLRLVGVNSAQLQPDLYRSGAGNSSSDLQAGVVQELQRLCADIQEPVRIGIFHRAAALYSAIQAVEVRRAKCRRNILAACLNLASLQAGVAPDRQSIRKAFELDAGGLSSGESELRSFRADGVFPEEVDVDSCVPKINTLFARLGLGAGYEGLRAAVADVVRTAVEGNVGTHSVLQSKVDAATFVVLRRCLDPRLVARPPTFAEFCRLPAKKRAAGPLGLEEARPRSGGAQTRPNTIEAFVGVLADYHESFFAPCFARAGLSTAPWAELVRPDRAARGPAAPGGLPGPASPPGAASPPPGAEH